MPTTIDVHNHLYPKDWVEHLEKSTGKITVKRTGPVSFNFYADGIPLSHVSNPGHYDPQARLIDMDKYGIDVNILSLSTPSVELVSPNEGVIWAKKVNDYFANLCQKYPKRFYACATLPYQDIDESVKELERAYKDLGVKGIMMFSNIDGKPIASPEFLPIYAEAEKYGLPIFIHPAPPLTAEIMKKLKLPIPLFGFIFDTTMAIMSLIFQGVLEKYPGLKFLHSHLGGVVPYTVGRIDDCFRSYYKEYGLELPKAPSEYYKSQVYVDSISYHVPAMKCCFDWMGPDHIMLGTDYAHPIGHIEWAIQYIRDMGLSEQDTKKILGGNAARIFKLKLSDTD
jgi:aminocarboxymuconate-semialdehyde decarboxylase